MRVKRRAIKTTSDELPGTGEDTCAEARRRRRGHDAWNRSICPSCWQWNVAAEHHPGRRTDGRTVAAGYRHGEQPAFALIVERYQRELFHFLVRFLGNRAAAEDVFQETFLQVHQSAEQFDLQRRFRPWLFTIAANKARDLIRSQAPSADQSACRRRSIPATMRAASLWI